MTQPISETSPEFDRTRIVERPNGFYWQEKDGAREPGPFATLFEAVADMRAADESELAPEETLEEERPRLEEH